MEDTLVNWGFTLNGILVRRACFVPSKAEGEAKRQTLKEQFGPRLVFCIVRVVRDRNRFKERARAKKKASGWIRWKTQAGSLISVAHNASPGRNTLCGLSVPQDMTRIQKDLTSKRCDFCVKREARNQRRKASREAYSPPGA